jgi:hypothetical protein
LGAYASPLATSKPCATFEGDFLSIETTAFIDDGCDVLEAEHVLRVAQHLELAAEQLPVGGEHELHADLPAFERLVRVEADQRQQLVYASCDALLVPAQQPRHGRDVLAGGQMREQPDLLDHIADLAAKLSRLARQHAAPANQDVAVAQRDQPVDQAHGGRLARARGPDEHAHLAGRHG